MKDSCRNKMQFLHTSVYHIFRPSRLQKYIQLSYTNQNIPDQELNTLEILSVEKLRNLLM